jgi:ABC-type transport system substrate-binding protein/signal transduction histidine kinase
MASGDLGRETARGGVLRIAFCPVDPNGLTTFTAFDPDSLSTANAIADGLIQVDDDGKVQPALAVAWQRVSPLEIEFELRRGVRFHDGSPFEAEDVVATLAAHGSPAPSAAAATILSPIAGATVLSEHRVRVETHYPDALLLRRLLFCQIYPREALAQKGRELFATQPIGTGLYRFVEWHRGRAIHLARNAEHWAGAAEFDHLEICIVREKEWVEHLASGAIDVAFNLDAHDAVRAERLPHVSVASRSASNLQLCLLRNQGPLADVRVRRALNHAVHRRVLVELTEHGMGAPQWSLATPLEEGYAPPAPYRYSPELARELLAQAGYANGLMLRGLVSETCASLYYTLREFLSRVGVTLDAEVVPFNELSRRVLTEHVAGTRYDGDFMLMSINNPLGHALFLQFVALFSRGPVGLTNDAELDAAFMQAATTIDPEACVEETRRVERLAVDRALMLYTVERHAHVAHRKGFTVSVPRALPLSPTFRAISGRPLTARPPAPSAPKTSGDTALLLEGTSHTDTFYLAADARFADAAAARVWANILVSQQRSRLAHEPLLREVVSLIESKESLASVLDSTERVALIGYTDEGRRLFVNRGYERMLGRPDLHVTARLPAAGVCSWPVIRAAVDAHGSWSSSVDLEVDGEHRAFFLTVTQALDQERVRTGYTFVFSDFSGEEERIKSQAVRSILDHVPYAVFSCDSGGRVLPGYSSACLRFFVGATVEGTKLTELLGMSTRETEHFDACYAQIFEDLLPAALALDQLPKRLRVGARICDLSGAVIRDEDGGVSGVLFTLLDVTDLAQAEEETARLRGVMRVLAFRSSFADFVGGFDRDLTAFTANARAGALDAGEARRVLHTAKGVFAQFSLNDLARLIHALEDQPELSPADLERVHAALRALLARNASVWNIRLERRDASYTLSESALAAFRACLATARTLSEAQALFDEIADEIRQRPMLELAGPLRESAETHAIRSGKRVDVVLEGFERPVPTRLAPVLSTLVHLTRNAIDHGLEPPEQRGDKNPVPSLVLSASREGSDLVIRVRDDGRGIDAKRLVERAIAAGVLTRDAAAELSHAGAIDLLFQDGVSTSETVTETSGRGVGMAAVKAAVVAAGGSVRVETELGAGTTFTLRFPTFSHRNSSLHPE